MKPQDIRTVFMGTPDFALDCLRGLIEFGVQLVGVYTQPDRPRGRGNKLAPPPVKELALQHDLPVLQPLKLRNPEAVEELRALNPDLIVVVAYGQILPRAVLDIPQYGCINVHASLLPLYRGAAPINKVIVDGGTETGVTTMLMDVGLDTGDMLIKRTLTIGPDETAGELHDRLAPLGREALEETLRQLCAGTLVAVKQDDDKTCYAAMMKKEDGLIDWNLSAQQIHNLVRGLNPWPAAYTSLNGETLKVSQTRVEAGTGEAGAVLSADDQGLCVACGEGVLRIGALQLPGKRMMNVSDFLRGHRLPAGMLLGKQ
ncbi:methionyl-tRNA formyltransferase [Geopsychrobacter electrodiphilus]|uniref:methionyl-tRNA formyltransferase n=1 Tax=Geopsychrobacter electrodiphilus TaxID=225196 RepID=UPI000360878E|nr:methionyl-tRNA formyltransferase [Geopsychrobacter electrodiphilus]